jgi:hypothetical protein
LKKGEKNSSEELHAVMHQALKSQNERTIDSRFEREHDKLEWQDKVQGSTEQKIFQAKRLEGGSISPVNEGGLTKYSTYCQNLTHGLPSGQSFD